MRKMLYVTPACLYMGLIYGLSSRPAPEVFQGWSMFGPVKLVHLVEYGILAILWVWGLKRATLWPPWRVITTAIIITFLWGISDEIHQAFVPGRSGKIADAMTDLLAASLAIVLLSLFQNISAKLHHGIMIKGE